MKKIAKYITAGCCAAIMSTLMLSCSKEQIQAEDPNIMRFNFEHPNAVTKLSENTFEANDSIGLYLTESTLPLDYSGNYVNNAPLTYKGGIWESATPIYWNNGTYNAYAYYPYTKDVGSITDYPVSVSTDQSINTNYMKSDFLWCSNKGITAGNGAVQMHFAHRMSRILIRLVKGEEYEGDLPDDATILIHNTVTEATADLNVGIITKGSRASAKTIKAKSLGNNKYSAIIVPQRIDNRRPLVEVIAKGVSYLYESKFIFKQGTQHNVSLVISDNPEKIKIEIGGEIEGWDE